MKPALFFILFLSLSTVVHSQTTNIKIPQSTHKVCQQKPKECLKLLPEQLQQIPKGSAAWFKLKDYQMWSEYLSAQYEALGKTTYEAVNSKTPPRDFEFSAAIYRAKYLLTVNKGEEAYEMMQKAKKLFAKLDASSNDPRRLIAYANLVQEEAHRLKKHAPKQVYRAKFLEARSILLKVKEDYKNLKDPRFHASLYANLGHIAASLENYVKYLEYRSRGLFWAKQTNSIREISVAHYNLARAYQANHKYKKAISEYQLSLSLSQKTENESIATLSLLRIIQNHINLGSNDKARQLFSKVSKSSLNINHEALYSELTKQLTH